jgi:hypothetical protein
VISHEKGGVMRKWIEKIVKPAAAEKPSAPGEPAGASAGQAASRNALEQRIQRAEESILENEALTEGLDDQAASVLLDWGCAAARQVIQSTAGLEDSAAEQVATPPLRAVRQMLRAVNNWTTHAVEMHAEEQSEALAEILGQAQIVYGTGFVRPAEEHLRSLCVQAARGIADPHQWIAGLRALLENPSSKANA